MRNSWPSRVLTSVAIAAAGGAWAAGPAGTATPEGTYQPQPAADAGNNAGANRGDEDGGNANRGPSPRDEPTPGLRLDDRMKRLPGDRNGKGDASNGANASGEGSDNGTGNGSKSEVPGTDVAPQNPANPATPLFPANPHPPADPGQPGNPVTPANLHLA